MKTIDSSFSHIFVDILVTVGLFQISPFYYSQICGLCGNFDGKQENEFQSPSRTDRSDSSCLVLDYLVPDGKCDSQSISKECQQPQTSSCKCSCGCWTCIETQIQASKLNYEFVILIGSRRKLIELLIDWSIDWFLHPVKTHILTSLDVREVYFLRTKLSNYRFCCSSMPAGKQNY